jgi:polar amino acid transport system substrate-binding protein
MLTLEAGTLKVASAFPDPPFELGTSAAPAGFDVELMRAICRERKLELQLIRYAGDDFNGIFAGLAEGRYDAVISGTTITPERSRIVQFSRPYLEFNQGVAVNHDRTPNVGTVADLRGLTAGIQSGNTSDIVARELVAKQTLAAIRYYPYSGIDTALQDLAAGRIGCVIKLFPVISWLVREYPSLRVALQVPTHEQIGIAYARDRSGLRDAIDATIEALRAGGEFAALVARWFP